MNHGAHLWRIRCIQHTRTSPFTASLRRVHDNRFSPLVPPNPASLPKPRSKENQSRRRTRFRRLAYTAVIAGGIILADTQWNASSITRSLRTFYTGVLIGVDYKINFRPNPPLADSIEALHARNAQRVFDLIRSNGGLYLKIGQAIAMQSAVLPPQFQKMFSRMFDDAPQNEWKDVERVIREDFGKSPEEVFGVSFDGIKPGMGVMEQTARASASVAQVHWARLADGREVAIKIQKREIAQQIGWDLWAFKVVSSVYSWWFDLPIHTLVPYISERLMLETDFVNEANNSEEMNACIQAEPRLRSKVYIPKIYRDLSSRRVMTAEW
jgi:aarF domain-containing kinase